MNYDDFTFMYPPRAANAVTPSMLDWYEGRGWTAQIKKNGHANVMAWNGQRLLAWTRHGEPHEMWNPGPVNREAFAHLKGWYVFVAELLHAKSQAGIRNTNFIHDLLVADGEQLVGVTFADRQKMLTDLFPNAVRSLKGGYRVIDPVTWLAVNYDRDFESIFNGLRAVEDEGLVLKRPNAKLIHCTRATANSGWLVKCRRPTESYSF